MSPIDDIRKIRLEKLEKLKSKNIEPYPVKTGKIISLAEILKKFKTLEKKKAKTAIAGRIIAKREHGSAVFADIYDGEAKLQAYFKKDLLEEESFNLFQEAIDIGDFIWLKGKVFTTKKGEKTLEAGEWKIISKALLPLPEKWH